MILLRHGHSFLLVFLFSSRKKGSAWSAVGHQDWLLNINFWLTDTMDQIALRATKNINFCSVTV
jgi:hypothetical protein